MSALDRNSVLAWVIIALAAVCLLSVVPVQGVYWDEYFQRLNGSAILDWYLSGFTDERVFEQGDLHLYGGIVEAPFEALAAILPYDPFHVRHVLVAVLGVVALWGTWRLGSLLIGARLGLLSVLLLATSPRFFGHATFNSKDIPTATFYILTLLLVVRDLRRPSGAPLARLIPAGIMLGALLGVRIGAAIVLPALLGGYLVRWWKGSRTREAFVRLTARFALVALIAWPVLLVGWPWALQRPLFRPVAALLANRRFRFEQLFFGDFVNTADLPFHYLPTWLAITLPGVLILGLCAALATAAWSFTREPRLPDAGVVTVLLAGVVPLAYIVATRVPVYDGVRHTLFLQPLIAIAAAWGLGTMLDHAGRLVPVAWAVVVAGVSLPVFEMAALSPYQYTYFNRIVGGLPGAEGQFELDYWGLSYREGVARLRATSDPTEVVASCSHPMSVEPFVQGAFEYAGSLTFGAGQNADYLLYTASYDCTGPVGTGGEVEPPLPSSSESTPWVVRRGVPLLHLSRLRASDG